MIKQSKKKRIKIVPLENVEKFILNNNHIPDPTSADPNLTLPKIPKLH